MSIAWRNAGYLPLDWPARNGDSPVVERVKALDPESASIYELIKAITGE